MHITNINGSWIGWEQRYTENDANDPITNWRFTGKQNGPFILLPQEHKKACHPIKNEMDNYNFKKSTLCRVTEKKNSYGLNTLAD